VVLEVGDYAYLRVSPIHGLQRFNVRGKLSPRFIGPFKIVERRGEVAYQLELPAQLSGVHDVFHVSQLKTCTSEVKIELVPGFAVPVQTGRYTANTGGTGGRRYRFAPVRTGWIQML
jgi:hypothetical protein